MARAGRKFAIPHGAQFPAQGLLGDADPEFPADPPTQIEDETFLVHGR